MSEYELVRARHKHAVELAPIMRQDDVNEIWASGRFLPLEALLNSLVVTRVPMAGLIDGKCLCMFGIATASFLSKIGIPWLMTGEGLEKHTRRFMRGSREFVLEELENFDMLVNHVDVRHTMAIRWLKWLGFTLDAAQPFGPDRMPFYRFIMTKDQDHG